VPVEVHVDATGAIANVLVSETSGNVQADALAVDFMRGMKFLPGLDAKGAATRSTVKVTVNMYKRGNRKVVRVTVKPPPMQQETLRVETLMCADFLWEVDRMRQEAGIRDASLEVMPYTSARLYMQKKHVPDRQEEKFWDEWPGALRKAVDRCEKDQTRPVLQRSAGADARRRDAGRDRDRERALATKADRARAPPSARTSTW
jgi:TonB family protein